MDKSLATEKAKEISSYVKAKYGERSLGYLRLLNSIPYFRKAVINNTLPQLLGMPCLSFEKFLREEANVIYKHHGSTFAIERLPGGDRPPGVLSTYNDDAFFSVSGAVVGEIRLLYPDTESLSGVPVVSLGRGGSVSDLLNNADIPGICAYVGQLPDEYNDGLATHHINDYQTLVATGTEIPLSKKYATFEAIHSLYVKLRRFPSPVYAEEELPSCKPEELMAVLTGMKAASVVPEQGGKLPKVILDGLKETHPTGVARDGAFYLTGRVELDPFQYIGSTRISLAIPSFEADVIRAAAPAPAIQDRSAPAATAQCVVAHNIPRPSVDNVRHMAPGFEAAIDHVLYYAPKDINNLDDNSEKEIALYGFEGGEAVYNKMSATAKTTITKCLPVGRHEPTEVIYKVSSALRAALRSRGVRINDEQYALMAAGRVIAWKGNWLVETSGDWDKLR